MKGLPGTLSFGSGSWDWKVLTLMCGSHGERFLSQFPPSRIVRSPGYCNAGSCRGSLCGSRRRGPQGTPGLVLHMSPPEPQGKVRGRQ